MKKLLSLLALLITTNTFAISVDQFCAQFSWDNEKVQCFKTANGKYIDEAALDICHGFSFDSEKMGCMNKILNKVYSPGEVRTCRDMSFDSEKLSCLVDLGRTQYPPRPGSMEEVKRLTTVGIRALRANDLYTVGQVLNQIYQISDTPILNR